MALTVDAADADSPVIDVARLRVALARLSRRLRRHELAGLTPTQLADQIAALPAELTVTAAVTVNSFQLVSEPGGRDVLRPG